MTDGNLQGQDTDGMEPANQIYYGTADNLPRYNPEDGKEVEVKDENTDSGGEEIPLDPIDPRELEGTQAAVATAMGIDREFDPYLEGHVGESLQRILTDYAQLSDNRGISKAEVVEAFLRDERLSKGELFPEPRLIGVTEAGELLFASGQGQPDLLFEEPAQMKQIAKDLGYELLPNDEKLLAEYQRIVGHPVVFVPNNWRAPRCNETVPVQEGDPAQATRAPSDLPLNGDGSINFQALSPAAPASYTEPFKPNTYAERTYPGIATVILADGTTVMCNSGELMIGTYPFGSTLPRAPHIGTRLLCRVPIKKA